MQDKLFYEDEFEALGVMISMSGKSFKSVAEFLFPHMKMESAYAKLKACLNPDKDERLTFGQIIAAMKFCDRFDPIMYACDDTLHARPERKAYQDQEANLIRVIEEASSVTNKALITLERLRGDHQPHLKSVRG